MANLESDDHSIALYTAFKDIVYNPQSVLYPSCGYDASPAKVFSQVTFVDLEQGNEGCIEALVSAGFNAQKGDIRNYVPTKQHDLLILLNPCIPSEWASRHVIEGGFILANDHHKNATGMFRDNKHYTLWGTIDATEKGNEGVIVSQDLQGLFEPVRDGEEFKLLRSGGYDFVTLTMDHFIRTGVIKVDINAPFEEKWVMFKRALGEDECMPSKRVAERYIFVKK